MNKFNFEIDGLTLKGSNLEIDSMIGDFISFEIKVNEIFQEEMDMLQDILDEKIDVEEIDKIEIIQKLGGKFMTLYSEGEKRESLKEKIKEELILYTPDELLTIDIYSVEHQDDERLEKIRLILPYMEDKEISYYVDRVCPVELRKGKIELEELDLLDDELKEMNTCNWGNIAYISIHGKGELQKMAKEKLDQAKYLCKSS